MDFLSKISQLASQCQETSFCIDPEILALIPGTPEFRARKKQEQSEQVLKRITLPDADEYKDNLVQFQAEAHDKWEQFPDICEESKVYFIQAGPRGAIKIGHTQRAVGLRLSALQTSCPQTLKVLGTVDGGMEQEKALHCRFKHLRIRGEWFKPSEELLAYINSLATN